MLPRYAPATQSAVLSCSVRCESHGTLTYWLVGAGREKVGTRREKAAWARVGDDCASERGDTDRHIAPQDGDDLAKKSRG